MQHPQTPENKPGSADDSWLAISVEGFAQQNAGRDKGHLVKELLQNGFDAIPKTGRVVLTFEQDKTGTKICCQDSGTGIESMETLRTVFWTSKKDSRLKRGRLGRGFKEMLCLARHTEVRSKGNLAVFYTENGNRKFRVEPDQNPPAGSVVTMWLDWEYKAIVPEMEGYFQTFLPPPDIALTVQGKTIPHRSPKHTVEAALTTETFEDGRWVKPSAKTTIELVPTAGGEQGMIYEMGIPVCPVEWDAPYHANVLQRVPMNPNRDAVMSGFPAKIHKACLPKILGEMSSEQARAAWVGEAAARSSDESIQKEVLERAFGRNLARSVPNFGKFSHDADAEETTGAKILDTKQLSGGFRELARTHVPTSADVAKAAEEEKRNLAAKNGFDPEEAKENSGRLAQLIRKHGREHVRNVCKFHAWMANLILADLFPAGAGAPRTCKVRIADFKGTAEGTWSNDFQILTLALDLDRIWATPTHRENFALLVHETAHELAAHHGSSFATAMESTAGAAIRALFEHRDTLAEWADTLAPKLQRQNQP